LSAEVQELAVRYGAAWADRDVNAITAMHSADTVYHLHGGGEPAIGLVATQEAFAAALVQWPDSQLRTDAGVFRGTTLREPVQDERHS
jgi:hypothetical protein